MRMTIRSIVMAALLLASAVPAFAQLAQPTQRQGRPVRGLFANGSGDAAQQLVLNVSFGAGYDKDKGGTASGGPGAPPIVYADQSGSYGTGSANLSYGLSWEKIQAGASVGSHFRYQNQTNDFTQSLGANAFVSAQLTKKTSVAVSQNVARQPHNLQMLYGSWYAAGVAGDPLMDLSGATGTGSSLTFNTAASLSQSITTRIGLSATYAHQQHGGWYGSSTKSTTDTVSAGIYYSIFRGARVRLAYGTVTSRYGSQTTRTTYDGLLADGGLDLGRAISLTRRLTFNFSIGGAGARNEGGDTNFILTGHSSLSYELGRSWTADLNFHRGVDYNQGLGQPVVVDSVSAGVNGDLSRRIQLNAGGGWVSGDVGIGVGGSSYSVATASASVRTALTRTMGISVLYAFRHYQFDNPGALPIGLRPNADRHTVRASLDLWVPLITRARRANASR